MAEEAKPESGDYEVKRPAKRQLGKNGKIAFGAAAAVLIGVGLYPVLVSGPKPQVTTSGVSEFQTEGAGSSIGRIADEPETGQEAAPSTFDIGPVEDRFAEQNAALAAEIARLQEELDSSKAAAGDEAAKYAALVSTMEDMRKVNAEAIARLEQQIQAGRTGDETAAQLAALEAQKEAARLAELERLREEQRAQLALRIKAPSVVFDETSRSSGGAGAGDTGSSGASVDAFGRSTKTPEERSREFVENGAPPLKVETAAVIGSPAYTVLQGTMIRATLENAVDSSLPGTVSAMVNYPVYSFDGSRVVIPAGSRVFGQYSSDVKIGQGRILVGWNRIVTPEGQSVQIAAYGGDEQGRSGITGKVDTRFGTRFGGAMLVSLIGSAPALAVANMEDSSEVARDAAEDVADDLSAVTGSVINEYVKLPPIIRVEQGQQITIMVDRDLEFY